MGIYGGTFNPIHLGHLRAAEEIREKFKMKKVVFVPSFIPPHKDNAEVVDPMHRLKMAGLAVTGNPFFSISEVELQRRGKSYSIDTIRQLKDQLGDDELAFIMGMDAFLEIETWYKYKEIFAECDFIVTSRPDSPAASPAKAIPEAVKGDFKKKTGANEFTHVSGRRLVFTEVSRLQISATAIRRAVRSGESIRYLLPIRVMEYIGEHGLYK